ncbi:MAG TPA: glycoside hydrolase family 43 protein [Flavisolibacter sp.]|nr:glycoside hydrolase family 43 protein [Flavisolibacter sp.]
MAQRTTSHPYRFFQKALVGFVFLFSFFTAAAQSTDSVYLFCYFKGERDGLHYAYSEDGYQWKAMFNDSSVLKPTVSKDKLFRDPCIIKGADGKYHMVWTVSWADKGIGYASSPDLIHWSEQQFIPVMMHEDSAKNTWAPEINYDPKKKEYMVYWATTIAGRFPQKDTSEEGKKNNHRMYYTTTKDFKKWSRAKLLYEPGFSVIDATIVHDGKQYVMFLKNETRSPVEKNLRVAFGKKLKGPYSAPTKPITGNYWAEGPTAIKVNGEWVVYFDKYRDRKYGAVASKDLMNWRDISDQVSFPKGMRHGTAFKVSRQEFERMKKK